MTINLIQLERKMKHLIPLTPKQLQIVQASLQLSLKYADSQYIDNVNVIMREIEDNTRFGVYL